MPVLCWSSLAGGFFSGRFRPDNLDTFEDYLDTICATTYGTPENFLRVERARQLAERGGGRALISICTAGGMGVVAILER